MSPCLKPKNLFYFPILSSFFISNLTIQFHIYYKHVSVNEIKIENTPLCFSSDVSEMFFFQQACDYKNVSYIL